MRRSIEMICILLCLVVPPVVAGASQVMSFCAIVANPTAFNLREVHVRALIKSDGIHHTWITDASCSEKGGIAFVPLDRSEGDPGVKQIMHAIYHYGPPGTPPGTFAMRPELPGKHIEATMSGIFLWLPDNGRVQRMLLVESASDVSVSMEHSQKKEKVKENRSR